MYSLFQGLHLHNILVVNVFLTDTDTNHRVYLLVGWVAPLISTSAWASLAFYNMEHELALFCLIPPTYIHVFRCWFGYNHKLFYWVSEGPRLVIILVI